MVVRRKPPEIDPATRRALEEMRASYNALLDERDDVQALLMELNGKIQAHTAMFQAYAVAIPERPQKAIVLESHTDRGIAGRAKRGSVKMHIDEALKSGAYKVSDLKDEIAKRFGIKYGISSLYRILSIGKGKEYEVAEGRWRRILAESRRQIEVTP